MNIELIRSRIHTIRRQQVMLDADLAALYEVETKVLNLAVKRNMKRFPPEFMFQLTEEEWKSLRFQNETSNRGGRRYLPHVFTEQGVAMLSGVLHSDRAIAVNIAIMKTFVLVREFALDYREFSERLKQSKTSTMTFTKRSATYWKRKRSRSNSWSGEGSVFRIFQLDVAKCDIKFEDEPALFFHKSHGDHGIV